MIGIPQLDSLSLWELILISWDQMRVRVLEKPEIQVTVDDFPRLPLRPNYKEMSQEKIKTLCKMEIETRLGWLHLAGKIEEIKSKMTKINKSDILLIENILTLYKNKVMGSEVAQEEWTQIEQIIKSLPSILQNQEIVERLKDEISKICAGKPEFIINVNGKYDISQEVLEIFQSILKTSEKK